MSVLTCIKEIFNSLALIKLEVKGMMGKQVSRAGRPLKNIQRVRGGEKYSVFSAT